MAKMEREMANLQGQYKMVEQTYGQDVLNLVLARGYLAKLLENVERFEGWLWLASGASMLVIRPGRGRVMEHIRVPWPGVALACRFDSVRVAGRSTAEPADEFEDILGRLLGGEP